MHKVWNCLKNIFMWCQITGLHKLVTYARGYLQYIYSNRWVDRREYKSMEWTHCIHFIVLPLTIAPKYKHHVPDVSEPELCAYCSGGTTGGGGGVSGPPTHLPWVSIPSPGTLPPPGLLHHQCNITFVIKFSNS